jgi:hypothetical protein
MLRPPAEVIGSKQHNYSSSLTYDNRAASWINLVLHTERATRGKARAFVRYHDLLADWTVPVHRIGDSLDLAAVRSATSKQMRDVHELIDPSLYRMRSDELDFPIKGRLKELMDGTADMAEHLAAGRDDDEVHATSDELREAYLDLYTQAEGIADSTTRARGRRLRRQHARELEQAVAGAPATEPARVEAQAAVRRRLLRRRQ